MIKDPEIYCCPEPRRVFEIITLNEAFQHWQNAPWTFQAFIHPDSVLLNFGAYCDKLKVKGFRIV